MRFAVGVAVALICLVGCSSAAQDKEQGAGPAKSSASPSEATQCTLRVSKALKGLREAAKGSIEGQQTIDDFTQGFADTPEMDVYSRYRTDSRLWDTPKKDSSKVMVEMFSDLEGACKKAVA
ncbi:hypothetical protein ACFU99_14490 [Streptomyces sp. NPDC057654]|uniref:hypothetical protein n=1 Tax=Streptomyces sp. NPDC057654 TaxID=3346196 RepID=UPI0036B83A4B